MCFRKPDHANTRFFVESRGGGAKNYLEHPGAYELSDTPFFQKNCGKMRAGLHNDNRIGLKTTKTTDACLFTLLATNLKGFGISHGFHTTTRNRHASYSLYCVRGRTLARPLKAGAGLSTLYRSEARGEKTDAFLVDTSFDVVVRGSKARTSRDGYYKVRLQGLSLSKTRPLKTPRPEWLVCNTYGRRRLALWWQHRQG